MKGKTMKMNLMKKYKIIYRAFHLLQYQKQGWQTVRGAGFFMKISNT